MLQNDNFRLTSTQGKYDYLTYNHSVMTNLKIEPIKTIGVHKAKILCN